MKCAQRCKRAVSNLFSSNNRKIFGKPKWGNRSWNWRIQNIWLWWIEHIIIPHLKILIFDGRFVFAAHDTIQYTTTHYYYYLITHFAGFPLFNWVQLMIECAAYYPITNPTEFNWNIKERKIYFISQNWYGFHFHIF